MGDRKIAKFKKGSQNVQVYRHKQQWPSPAGTLTYVNKKRRNATKPGFQRFNQVLI